jgi:hypothetical protein
MTMRSSDAVLSNQRLPQIGAAANDDRLKQDAVSALDVDESRCLQ